MGNRDAGKGKTPRRMKGPEKDHPLDLQAEVLEETTAVAWDPASNVVRLFNCEQAG